MVRKPQFASDGSGTRRSAVTGTSAASSAATSRIPWRPEGDPLGAWFDTVTKESYRPHFPDATHPEFYVDYMNRLTGERLWIYPDGHMIPSNGVWEGDMMAEYKELFLDQEALRFFRERINTGLPLATEVLARHDLARGRLGTLVPVHVSRITSEILERGGLFRSSASREWVLDAITKYLSAAPDRLCVLEDHVGRSSDPGLSLSRSRIVTCAEYVYFVLCADDTHRQRIERSLWDAASASITYGFMTAVPPGWNPDSGHFSKEDMEFLADKTEKIVVDAYDGEGWLIWEKE